MIAKNEENWRPMIEVNNNKLFLQLAFDFGKCPEVSSIQTTTTNYQTKWQASLQSLGCFFCNSSSYPTIFDDLIDNNLKKMPQERRRRRRLFFQDYALYLARWSNITSTKPPSSNLCHWHLSVTFYFATSQQVTQWPMLRDLFANQNHLCCCFIKSYSRKRCHNEKNRFQMSPFRRLTTLQYYDNDYESSCYPCWQHWCYYFQAGPNLTFFLNCNQNLLQLPRVTFINVLLQYRINSITTKKCETLTPVSQIVANRNWCSSWSRHMKLYFCAVCKFISRLREDPNIAAIF